MVTVMTVQSSLSSHGAGFPPTVARMHPVSTTPCSDTTNRVEVPVRAFDGSTFVIRHLRALNTSIEPGAYTGVDCWRLKEKSNA